MNTILFVAAEAVPFAKTGGLADVIGSLPRELVKHGNDIRIIMPQYGIIPEHLRARLEPVCQFEVSVGWRRQYCGINCCNLEGITYYFVDNEYYFKRERLYGFYDDAERFAFFNRAVLEALPQIGFMPQIIHCHDWHAAMVPVLLREKYAGRPEYAAIKTVLTIHNLQYQGIFPPAILGDLLDLNEAELMSEHKLEFFGNVNFLKGGIVYSDAVTTVSKSYAEEILGSEYGEKLDGLLRKRRQFLTGIVNGIDYQYYNPAQDEAVPVNYTWRSPARKQQNKVKLQATLGLTVDPDIPVVAMVTRLVQPKGLDLVAEVMEEMLGLGIQLVILGTGDDHYVSMFSIVAYQHPQQMSCNLYFDDTLARRIFAGSDIFLMPSLFEPCGIGQLIALRYGSLPVVRETGGLKDTIQPYNEYTGEGNGFSFARYSGQDMLEALRRALAVYRQPDRWKQLVVNAMRSDFSWRASAEEYMTLYAQLNKELNV